MHLLQPASLASSSNSASQGWTNVVNLGVPILLSIKWDDLSTCLIDLCLASGKGLAALYGRNHPGRSNMIANTHLPHPSLYFHYQGLSRPLQRGRCPRGGGRRAFSKGRPSVRSMGVSVLCDRVHKCVHTLVHKTCLHSSGSSWGAGTVPGVFGTFCSGTLPSWVALMTQQFRNNSLSFPASRYLSQ